MEKYKNRMYDIAAGPTILLMVGPPILLVAAVVGLTVLAVRLVFKIWRERKK